MEIANPIYDVVFKYLMEDQKVAKIILSALTKLDIISLELLPQELSVDKSAKNKKYIYRIESVCLQAGFFCKNTSG